MTPFLLDIEVPRNGSDDRLLYIYDIDDNGVQSPRDLTNHTASAIARDVFGGAVIATAVCSIPEPTLGRISMKWLGSQFDNYGDTMALVIAAYDLKLIDEASLPTVPVRGTLYITPESTA